VLDEFGSLFVHTGLVGGELATASTALLDTAEEDDAGKNYNTTGNGRDNGNLGSLAKSFPTVLDALGLLDLLENRGFFTFPAHVSLWYKKGYAVTYATTLTFCQSPEESMSAHEYSLAVW